MQSVSKGAVGTRFETRSSTLRFLKRPDVERLRCIDAFGGTDQICFAVRASRGLRLQPLGEQRQYTNCKARTSLIALPRFSPAIFRCKTREGKICLVHDVKTDHSKPFIGLLH